MDFEVQIPTSVENMQLPAPELVQYYEDLDHRCIWVVGEIGTELLDLSSKIMKWNAEDRLVPAEDRIPIRLYIFSLGGDLAVTMNTVSVMRMSKTPIYTYNMGECFSGAFVLLIAGHKRFALPYSRAMCHFGSGVVGGTYGQTDNAMKDYKVQIEAMKNFIVDRTKISQKVLNKKMTDDWYLTLDEQIANGVVDSVIDSVDTLIGEEVSYGG